MKIQPHSTTTKCVEYKICEISFISIFRYLSKSAMEVEISHIRFKISQCWQVSRFLSKYKNPCYAALLKLWKLLKLLQNSSVCLSSYTSTETLSHCVIVTVFNTSFVTLQYISSLQLKLQSFTYLWSRMADDKESTSTCLENGGPQYRLPPGTGHWWKS